MYGNLHMINHGTLILSSGLETSWENTPDPRQVTSCIGQGYIFFTMLYWLVVGRPLWKIWKSIGMIRTPIYGKMPNSWQPVTTNQFTILHGHSFVFFCFSDASPLRKISIWVFVVGFHGLIFLQWRVRSVRHVHDVCGEVEHQDGQHRHHLVEIAMGNFRWGNQKGHSMDFLSRSSWKLFSEWCD